MLKQMLPASFRNISGSAQTLPSPTRLGTGNSRSALTVSIQATLQAYTCQSLLHPSPCYLLSLLTCKALVLAISPPNNQEIQRLSPLQSFASGDMQPEMLQKLHGSWKTWVCLGLRSLCHTTSSCAWCH